MKRAASVILLLLWYTPAVPSESQQRSSAERFDAFEKSIVELQEAMERGETTSRDLVRQYLERIEAFDVRGPKLNSFIYVNPRAIEEAEALDRERAQSGSRGPLHGIPIALKDNYDTRDMPTSGSSIALTGFIPPDDGYQVRKLREAGAVLLGKTNMHELARGITTISSLGGQTLNPYDPERNPGGSSGGTGAAVAANLAAVGMGSDTCGSIRIPAANNNLFGLRVTQGLSSRDGIIPLSHTQDVGGPLARSMTDLVIVLDATVGPDPSDPQTVAAEGRVPDTYRAFLKANGLNGVRLGLLKSYLLEVEDSPEKEVTAVVKEAVSVMTEHGAQAMEIEIEGLLEIVESAGVIRMEFEFDLRDYLSSTDAPVRSLTEILDRGLYHDELSERFKTSNQAQENSSEYRKALAQREAVSRLLRESMAQYDLDAVVYPTLRHKPALIGEPQFGTSCAIAAHSGLPAISLPAGFTPDGIPVGVELLGKAFGEGDLIAIGYAYEQAVRPRRSPARTPSLVSDGLSRYFELSSHIVRGRLRLDRPTQRLHYDLELSNLLQEEILDVKLHRGAPGENGPVVALLGTERNGDVAIRNEDLDALLAGHLYLVIYTADAPLGAARAQIIGS